MADNSRYAGMTVNERLSVAGLLDEFDKATIQRDREQMIIILQKVEIAYEQAVRTTDTILAYPSNYGY